MKLGIKRIGAFLLDCTILFFALTMINMFIPTFGNVENLSEKTIDIMEEYLEGNITEEKFVEETNDLNYNISKGTYLYTIAGIVVYILYFVVYQAYNNGQTLGKKVFKIQVLKLNDELPDKNCLIIRSLIPYGILTNFILLILILFVSKNVYLNINITLSNIHMIVIFISILLMFIKGRGIQDYLAKTKVKEV